MVSIASRGPARVAVRCEARWHRERRGRPWPTAGQRRGVRMSTGMDRETDRGGAWTRPNFLFILADDLGYADLGCYGGREPCSPNLDRLATEGLLFTNGYANSSVCSPTRFALATGRWQHRLRGGADEPIASRSP